MFDGLKQTVTHPLSVFGGLLVGLESGVHVLDATANLWFPLVGVLSQLGSELAMVPAVLTNNLFIAAAMLYGAFKAAQLARRVRSEL